MPPPRAPEPTRILFDPFNSSSTGHQRAENRLSGSTSWRDFRTHKLAQQLCDTSGRGGETHLTDLVGGGSESFGKDGRKENGSREVGLPGSREEGWQDIRGLMGGNKKRKSEEMAENSDIDCKRRKHDFRDGAYDPIPRPSSPSFTSQAIQQNATHVSTPKASALSQPAPKPIPEAQQIFRSLTLYLNGSTHASGISDHKLKSIFIQHGGCLSMALGRRTVTHVVLGSDSCGLAAGKIQKEVTRVGGKGVKYVTAKWVVDSVDCGKRLPESRYQAVHIAMKGQGSMLGKLNITKQEPSSVEKGS
jgi:BRCT domain, a BRCA1 C-terminus domain